MAALVPIFSRLAGLARFSSDHLLHAAAMPDHYVSWMEQRVLLTTLVIPKHLFHQLDLCPGSETKDRLADKLLWILAGFKQNLEDLEYGMKFWPDIFRNDPGVVEGSISV